MKLILRLYLVLVCTSFSIGLFAQSFVSEGKQWRYSIQYCHPIPGQNCSYHNYAYKFQGDSTVNEINYKKLYESTDELMLKWQFYSLWRETNDNKIYEKYRESFSEEFIYNFSLEKGDNFISSDLVFKVDSVINKEWGGKIRKHWYLNYHRADNDSAYLPFSTLWIEGLGQIRYFGESTCCAPGAAIFLLCFTENGQQVYQNPKFNTCFYTSVGNLPIQENPFKIYPNPVFGTLYVNINQSATNDILIELYDIDGRLVKTDCLATETQMAKLDVSDIKNGVYILCLVSGGKRYSEQLIISKK